MRQSLESLVWSLVLVLGSLLWLWARGPLTPPGVTIEAAQMRQAHGPWMPLDTAALARWSGPLELRWQLHLAQPEAALGLRVAIRGAGELRCRSETVLRNGRAAAEARDELPGLVDRWVALPALPPGVHELSWRGSSHFVPGQRWRFTEATLEPLALESVPRARYGSWMVVAVAWGGLALTWLYFLRVGPPASALGADGRGAYRTLVALGAVGLLLPLVESARELWGYPYPWHQLRLRAVLVCTLLAAWLLPLWALLALRAPVRRMAWAAAWGAALLLGAVVLLMRVGHDGACWALHFAALLATGLLFWKFRRGQASRGPEPVSPPLALVGIGIVLMLLFPSAFLDGLYTITLAALMMLAMLRHARAQHERTQREAALRQTLQTRLLRTSMQPHGLMNTLAVLQELIEQRPAQASQLVERLADQFSLLRELSQQDRVGIREELELVRTQLDLVGMARDIPVRLEVQGRIDGVSLPPGVLHTLVENAITHGGVKTQTNPSFAVRIDDELPGRWRIRLSTPRGAGREGGSGQGHRFVRESLAGAYGDNWSYEGRAVSATTWEDSLSVPRA